MRVEVTMDSGAVYKIDYKAEDLSFDDKIRFSNPTDFLAATSGHRVILSKIESFKPMEGTDNE